MSHVIIDRRKNDKKKSSVNRQRFMKRVKGQVQDAVKKKIRDGKIKDIVTDENKDVVIPGKGLNEPSFQHSSKGGKRERVLPGNDRWHTGDRPERPPEQGGNGQGENASDDGEGEDEFYFKLTKEEFLDIFFDTLELPFLTKKSIEKTEEWENRRAGFSIDGIPSRLNVVRSMKQAKGRRTALRSMKKKKLKKLLQERDEIVSDIERIEAQGQPADIEKDRLKQIDKEIETLRKKLKAIPFVDEVDLRYNRWEKQPIPTTQAVMFCVMDVSGSMDEWKKEISKSFFMLLYLFLYREYDHVDIVFIRHHTIAKEVDEDEFYYSTETGGTLLSPALDLVDNIINERYSSNWNIFMCHASDGDNFSSDNTMVKEYMDKLLPKLQYSAYIEVDKSDRMISPLWEVFYPLSQNYENFNIARITNSSEIFPVLEKLFEKRDA